MLNITSNEAMLTPLTAARISIAGSSRFSEEKREAIATFRAIGFHVHDLCDLYYRSERDDTVPIAVLKESLALYIVSDATGYAGDMTGFYAGVAVGAGVMTYASRLLSSDWGGLIPACPAEEFIELVKRFCS